MECPKCQYDGDFVGYDISHRIRGCAMYQITCPECHVMWSEKQGNRFRTEEGKKVSREKWANVECKRISPSERSMKKRMEKRDE